MKNTIAVEKQPVVMADDDDIQFNILHTEYHDGNDSNDTNGEDAKEKSTSSKINSQDDAKVSAMSDLSSKDEQDLNNKSAKKVSFDSPSTEDSTIITKSGGSTKKVKSKGEKSTKVKTKSLKIKSSKSKSKHKRKPKVKVHVSFSSSDDSDSDNDSNASNSEIDDTNHKEKIKKNSHEIKHKTKPTKQIKPTKQKNPTNALDKESNMSETDSDAIDVTGIVQVDEDVMKLASEQKSAGHKSTLEQEQNSDADDSLVDVSHDNDGTKDGNNVGTNAGNVNNMSMTGSGEEIPYISSDEVEEFYGKGVDDKSILQEYFNTI